MSLDDTVIRFHINFEGIIFYSPESVSHIKEGEDYFTPHYSSPEVVLPHVMQGTLVGFGTGTPGDFILHFHSGYPDDAYFKHCEFKLRLGLHCRGGTVCFRDLGDLRAWRKACPAKQTISLPDGYYHVTLTSERPDSGTLGDWQVIDVHLQSLPTFPRLKYIGVPQLCADVEEDE
jgi:hypothetical protein